MRYFKKPLFVSVFLFIILNTVGTYAQSTNYHIFFKDVLFSACQGAFPPNAYYVSANLTEEDSVPIGASRREITRLDGEIIRENITVYPQSNLSFYTSLSIPLVPIEPPWDFTAEFIVELIVNSVTVSRSTLTWTCGGGNATFNITNESISTATPPPIATGFQWPYQWPLVPPRQRYAQYSDTNTQCGRIGVHHALDLTEEGVSNPQVYAVADGKVVKVGEDIKTLPNGRVSGYGYYVVIWHKLPDNSDVFSLYAHLLPGSVQVQYLQAVHRGDIIGQQDTSGGANEVSHLHFELRKNHPPDPNNRCPLTEADANKDWYDPAKFIPDHWWQQASHSQTVTAVNSLVATELQNTATTIDPGQLTNTFYVLLQGLKKFLSFAIDFPGSSLEVTIFRPNGSVYSNYLIDEPPALIMIPDPADGNWGYSIRAVDVPSSNYPFAVSVGVRDEPLIDTGEDNSGIPSDAFTGDVIPPTTTIAVSPQVATGIYNQPVEVSFFAEDNLGGEGVALTLYSLDGGISYQTYSLPFSVSTEGINTILFYSQDGVGNSEIEKMNSIIIDTTPPGIPVLRSPLDQSLVRSDQVSFQWEASTDAVHYEIRMGETNPPSIDGIATTSAIYVPPFPLIPRTYYWQVRAFDEAGNASDWSIPNSVTVYSPPNVAPTTNYFTTSTPTLTWNRVSWANHYEVQLANNRNFMGATVYPLGNDLSFTVPISLANGTYFWRVRACISVTNCGVWSPTGTFIVDV